MKGSAFRWLQWLSLVVAVAAFFFKTQLYTVFGVERAIAVNPDEFPTDDEIATLESSMPSPQEHGWFDSVYKSAKLHYRTWPLDTAVSPRAVTITFDGISAHAARGHVFPGPNGGAIGMALQARVFLEQNITHYSMDMYGHGYSEGTRVFIPESYKNNVQDTVNFIRLVAEAHEGVPVFAIGSSYGGTLLLHAAKYFQDKEGTSNAAPDNFNSLILMSPAVVADVPGFPVLQFLIFLSWFLPEWSPFFMPDPLNVNRIWRDPAVVALYFDPTYPGSKLFPVGKKLRLGTGAQLIAALDDVKSNAIPGLKIPFLVLHGTDDISVPIEGAEFLFDNAATADSDKEFLRKEGGWHSLLLADPLRDECMQDIISWIDKRVELV